MTLSTLSKHKILDTAAKCFMQQGYHATSIDVIARELGATKGRVYHHFASKIQLFFEVHREGMRRLFDAVLPATQAKGSALDVLERMLHAHALALFEYHTYESVVVQGVHLHRFGSMTPSERLSLNELITSRDEFEALFKHQLMLIKRNGGLKNTSVSIASKTILGAIQWSLIWYRPELDSSPSSRSRLARSMVSMLLEGLKN